VGTNRGSSLHIYSGICACTKVPPYSCTSLAPRGHRGKAWVRLASRVGTSTLWLCSTSHYQLQFSSLTAGSALVQNAPSSLRTLYACAASRGQNLGLGTTHQTRHADTACHACQRQQHRRHLQWSQPRRNCGRHIRNNSWYRPFSIGVLLRYDRQLSLPTQEPQEHPQHRGENSRNRHPLHGPDVGNIVRYARRLTRHFGRPTRSTSHASSIQSRETCSSKSKKRAARRLTRHFGRPTRSTSHASGIQSRETCSSKSRKRAARPIRRAEKRASTNTCTIPARKSAARLPGLRSGHR
jgi:hypothetical protein